MRVHGYKIYCLLLLICVIGLSVSICCSFANSQKQLSDREMSYVYGGDCGPCEGKGTQGCSSASALTCAERYQKSGTCSGYYRQSCKTDEKECKNTNQNSCTNTTPSCPGVYNIYKCVQDGDSCVTQNYQMGISCSAGGDTYHYCQGG